MQRIGFALPMALAVPFTIMALNAMCNRRATNACYMSNTIAKEHFWKCFGGEFGGGGADFVTNPQMWIWMSWLISQLWVTVHLWLPKHERLARSEK